MLRHRLIIFFICSFALISAVSAQTIDLPATPTRAITPMPSTTVTAPSATATTAAAAETKAPPTVVTDTSACPTALSTSTDAATQEAQSSAANNCLAATATPYWIAPPTQAASGPVIAQDIPLSALGVNNFTLVDPRGSAQFRFTIPDNWSISGNNSLSLSIQFFQDVISGTNIPDRGSLYIYIDNQPLQLLGVLPNSQEMQQITVPLPLSLLADTSHPTHTLRISLDTLETCLNNINSRLFVDSTQSMLHFEYQTSSPLLDLASFPRPFYNHEIGAVPQALIVMPDKASADDWETAASLAAGLGQMTGNQIQLQTVTAQALTAQQRHDSNLILIGQPSENALTADLYRQTLLPTTLDTQQQMNLGGKPIANDNGIVQLIANPENPNRAMLVVTGQSSAAVKKAAQALSDPTLRLGQSGTLMIVTDVHPPTTAAAVNIVTNRATFSDLGYGTQDLQVNGLGTSFLDVQFKLPQGYQADAGSFVELYFNAADTLADSTSVVSVFMNDTPLQSIALSTGTAAQAAASVDSAGRHVLHAVIPTSSLIPGELNDLSIQVDIEGQWHCAPPNDSSLWFAVSPDSFISVPRSTKTQVATTRTVGQFPGPFTQSPDLHDVWFVLPTQPTALDFQQLIDLTQKLGVSTLSGATFNPRVSFGELPKGADATGYNFIILGLPSSNPFLNGLNKSLPQPFIPGSDQIQQIIDNVVYQLPAQFNLGILQALPSDWNPDHTVLVITGITPQGQKEAGQILTAGIVPRSQLTGNVVFSRSTGIISVDTGAQQRRLDANLTAQSPLSTQEATEPPATLQALTPSLEASPEPSATIYQIQAAEVDGLPTATLVEATPTAIPTFMPLPNELLEPAKVEQPQWVNVLIIVTGGIILLTLFYGLIRLIRSRRSVI